MRSPVRDGDGVGGLTLDFRPTLPVVTVSLDPFDKLSNEIWNLPEVFDIHFDGPK